MAIVWLFLETVYFAFIIYETDGFGFKILN